MTTEPSGNSGELRDRLAKVLEPLLPNQEVGTEYRARDWANRYLTDANAAIRLLLEEAPGVAWEVYHDPDTEFVAEPCEAAILPKGKASSRGYGQTPLEAICRAFVAWKEAEGE